MIGEVFRTRCFSSASPVSVLAIAGAKTFCSSLSYNLLGKEVRFGKNLDAFAGGIPYTIGAESSVLLS